MGQGALPHDWTHLSRLDMEVTERTQDKGDNRRPWDSRFERFRLDELSLACHARLRRYSLGVWPVALRNMVLKELVSVKPRSSPIAVMDPDRRINRTFARSIRRLM